MRDSTGLQLKRLIVHVVNPRTASAPQLSDVPLPLPLPTTLDAYIVEHIQNSLADVEAKAARFVAIDPEAASGLCQGLLNGGTDLVAGSRSLVEQLFAIIRGDQRIAPGLFAVCEYRAANYPEVPHFLALLKLDPSDVFRHALTRDASGRNYVTLEVMPNALPTPRERLQKCAFLRPLTPRLDYDMLLLDRQTRGTDDAGVARFFTEKFLGTEWAFDPYRRTKLLYETLIGSLNDPELSLAQADREYFADAIHALATSTSVNLDEWLPSLSLPAPTREQVAQQLDAVLPDRQFVLDEGYQQRFRRRRRFRGDYGLTVQVDADSPNMVIRAQPPGGTDPFWTVTIQTRTWRDVSYER